MKKKFYPNTIIQTLGLFFVSLLLTSPLIFLQNNKLVSQEVFMTGFYFIIFLVMIGIKYLVNHQRKIITTNQFKIDKTEFLPLMILLVIVFQVGLAKPINHLANVLLNKEIALTNPIEMIILTLGAIILAPILEEIIFRGTILRGFLSNYSPKKAIIYSALIFGIIHGKPELIWGAILIGLFFGWVYYKTKSIGITIILHVVANFSVLFQSYLYYKYSDLNTVTTMGIYFIPISLILIFIISNRLYKKMRKVDSDHSEKYRAEMKMVIEN